MIYTVDTFVHFTVIGVSPTAWHFNWTFWSPFATRINLVFCWSTRSAFNIILGGTTNKIIKCMTIICMKIKLAHTNAHLHYYKLPFILTWTIWWIAWPIPLETWHKYLPEWYECVFWNIRLPLMPMYSISSVEDLLSDSRLE